MQNLIHPTAIIDPKAELDSSVEVGPYTTIGAGVRIDAGTKIASHVVIEGPTTIGKHNEIFQFSSLGAKPQDKKFKDEPTLLEIGDHNTIREFCTFNRGTVQDKGTTKIATTTGSWRTCILRMIASSVTIPSWLITLHWLDM